MMPKNTSNKCLASTRGPKQKKMQNYLAVRWGTICKHIWGWSLIRSPWRVISWQAFEARTLSDWVFYFWTYNLFFKIQRQASWRICLTGICSGIKKALVYWWKSLKSLNWQGWRLEMREWRNWVGTCIFKKQRKRWIKNLFLHNFLDKFCSADSPRLGQ